MVTGAVFTLFVLLLTDEPWILFFVVPAAALIGFLNIRLTKFCDSCGATLVNPAWFRRMRFCPSCGAPMGEEGRGKVGGAD